MNGCPVTRFAAAAVLLSAATAWAQPPAPAARLRQEGAFRVVRWTTAEGLPQNTVNDIVLLPNGELWLATFGGLARFDGHRFHVLDIAADDGLPANRVLAMAPAGADGFWFLTQQGHLGRVDAGRAATLVPPAHASIDALDLSVSDGRLLCMLVDGSIWQTDGRQPWRQVLGSSNSGGMLHAFATTEDGQVWAGWGDRLVRLRDASVVQSVTLPSAAPEVFAREGGGLWLGLIDGLATVVDGRLHRVDLRPAIRGRVHAIGTEGAGVLWVATSGTLSALERQPDGSLTSEPVPVGLSPGSVIRSLRADPAGNLWVGTNGNGLLRVNRTDVTLFGERHGLAEITALADDGAGGAYVTSGCRGLFHLDAGGASAPVRLRDPRAPGRLDDAGCGISLASATHGAVWARFGSSLFRVEQKGERVQRIREDLPDEEGPLATTRNGSVWVLSRRGSLQLLSPAGSLVRHLELEAPLVSASVAPDDSLWVGGDGQVFRVAEDGVQRFGQDVQVPRGLARDVVAEADGTVWIATYGGGVGRLRAGRVQRVTAADGLPDNSVSRILNDSRGRVWISTNRGLVVVGRAELEAVADRHLRAVAPVVLGPERGVPEANFGSPAGFADPAGRLWFGTIEGVVLIDAAAFPARAAPPVVRIEDVKVDDRQLAVADPVRIPPLPTRVQVAFSTSELRHAERVRFRFMVEGVHESWVDGGTQPSLDWTPPRSGRYRLLVEARNEDGLWSAAPAVLALDVAPAWWQTAVFRAAVMVLGGLALFAAFGLRVRTIERRHAERLRALDEQRQAAERVASLRAQLEHVSRVALAGELAASLAHEVSQPLGAIVNNAEAGKRHLPRYLRQPDELAAVFSDIVADGMRASEVVRGLRGFLRPQGADAAPVDLSAVVRDTLPLLRRELRDNRVDVQLDLAEDLPLVDGSRIQLSQVVANLVMNACEALADTPGERLLRVATSTRGGRVELAVGDNGPGLAAVVAARVFDPFVTTKPGGLGMGLAICRAIAEAHGGHVSADPVQGGGLQVTLSLPAPARTSDR